MSQNLEKFGVEAVWYDAKFEKGARDYNATLKKSDAQTKKSMDSMAKSWQLSGDAIDKMVSDYVGGGQKVAQTSRKLGDDAKKGARGFSLAFTEIRSVIMLGIGALRTFARAAAAAFNAAREGAAQLGQQRSFAIVSGGAEQAAKNLQAMRDATRGTATDAKLMEAALGILATGLAKNEEELFAVTRNVTTLGRTFKGFGSERSLMSFQLLSSDLEASRARLDDFGLSYDKVKAKQEAFIASGMDLQEATRTALLEEMSVVMEKLGLNAATTADSFGQLTAVSGNLTDSFKQSLAPAGAIVADAFVAALTEANNADDAFKALAETGIQLASVYTGITAVFDKYVKAQGLGILAMEALGGEFGIATTFQDAYTASVERGTQAMNEADDIAAVLPSTLDDVATATDQAADALDRFNTTMAGARTQALEAFLKRAIAVERQLEDAALARARKVEDIARQSAQRRAQIEEQFAQTIANLQDQAAEQRRQNASNLARQLEQIERNYQERKRAIEQQFAVSFSRAVRSRDALALVEAIRTRKTDLDEAKRQRDQERSEATTNAAQQEEEQARSLQRQIEAARAARAQQLVDAAAAEAKQLEDMQRAEARKTEDRARAAARWLEDQTRAFQDRRVRAQSEYQQNEAIYTRHLQRMLALTRAYIPRIFGATGGGGGVRGRGPGGRQRLATGGAFVVNQATDFTAGEAGPEMVIAQPLSQITNVNAPSPQVVGSMRHQVAGDIQASMAGFEGRLTAAVNEAVLDAFGRVLQ